MQLAKGAVISGGIFLAIGLSLFACGIVLVHKGSKQWNRWQRWSLKATGATCVIVGASLPIAYFAAVDRTFTKPVSDMLQNMNASTNAIFDRARAHQSRCLAAGQPIYCTAAGDLTNVSTGNTKVGYTVEAGRFIVRVAA